MLEIYHGSTETVADPEIRTARFTKDFSTGFYCTMLYEQAFRWATRFGKGIVNHYEYTPNPDLRMLSFSEMTEDWLDFIAACRSGKPHDYDMVEGPMADDTIYNYVQAFMDGSITREAFWALAKFKRPTHQICFCTERSLETLRFLRGEEVHAKE